MANHTKLLIIGSGPAGYTAGIYASRAQLEPIMVAGLKSGGQLMNTSDVENYPGFKEGKNGPALMMEMRAQAEKFGTTIVDSFVTAVDFSARPFKAWTVLPPNQDPEATLTQLKPEELASVMAQIKTQPHEYEADSVIISTGAYPLMVGAKGEWDFMGKGLSTCAVCDAAFYKDKDTVVVGGGDSAMEDTLALTKFARSVTIIHRRDQFRASKIMQDRVLNNPKVKVLWNTTLLEVAGSGVVEKIKVNENGQEKEYAVQGVFIAIGHKPMTQLFADQVVLDDHGFVITRVSPSKAGVDAAAAALKEDGLLAFPTMTSVEGVFAAGDVVDLRYKQAVTAAGQGCMAALDAERWLEAR